MSSKRGERVDRARGILLGILIEPFRDLLGGLERVLVGADGRPRAARLGLVLLSVLLGWWVYVPVHELLHAVGCLAFGGEVTRLEISPLYLGEMWERLVPWVVSGGPYAGRLAGFETHGRDAVYLSTVFAPYLLTLFPGVWAMRMAASKGAATVFGLVLPTAFAPFISLLGDAYEIGSILVTLTGPWSDTVTRELVRGDDLLLVWGVAGATEGVAVGTAALVGAMWALATYGAAGLVARRLGAPHLALEA